LAARTVCDLDRTAVLCARRKRAAHPGVVRAHRSSGREGPVFPLRRKQCRELSRADRVPARHRALRAAGRPDARLDGGILSSDSVDRGMRLADDPRAGESR
jgi:hypothetical protein